MSDDGRGWRTRGAQRERLLMMRDADWLSRRVGAASRLKRAAAGRGLMARPGPPSPLARLPADAIQGA